MIYIILGGSRAGKTTFTMNSFLRCKSKEYRDIITLTETKTAILFGTYKTDDRRKGTDTTTRNDILRYFEQIERLIEKEKDIILEGTRVSGKLLQQLFIAGYPVQLIWIKCSPEKILERNRDAGNTQTAHHFVAETTKAQFAFWRYAIFFDGLIYDTDSISQPEQWEQFSIKSECIKNGDKKWFIEMRNFFLKADFVNQSDDYATVFSSLIEYPSFLKLLANDKGFKSVFSRSFAYPELISGRWKK